MWGLRHDSDSGENTSHRDDSDRESDRESDSNNTIQMMASPFQRASPSPPSPSPFHPTRYKMPRTGIELAATVLTGTLVVNALFAGIALLSYARFHGRGAGGATVYVGTCDAVEGWNSAIHLLGNVLASVAVAACVYALQWVLAPSRAEVDRAHVRRWWRAVGSLGWRNWRGLEGRKVLLALGVVGAAGVFHMMVNSAVYASKTLRQFDAFLASAHAEVNEQLVDTMGPDRCLGGLLGWNKAGFNAALKNGQFERLDADACRRRFENPLSNCNLCGTGQGSMVLLSSELKNQSLFYASAASLPETGEPWMADLVPWQIPEWNVTVPLHNGSFTMNPHLLNGIPMVGNVSLRGDLATMYDFLLNNYTESMQSYTGLDRFRKFLREAHWNNATWAARAVIHDEGLVCTPANAFDMLTAPYLLHSPQYRVDGCLNQKITEDCELTVLPAGVLLVLACSLVQVGCVYLIARHGKPGALLTVGDAVASFLENPDPSTTGRCMMSKATVGRWEAPWLPWLSRQRTPAKRDPTISYPEALPRGERWYHAASLYQWGVAVLLALAHVGLLGWLLIGYFPQRESVWELSGKKALASNTPHLALSLLYLFYDDIFTCMAIVDEYSQYALQRMPLRVSRPRGIQRSTYYLSLPYKYAVPLLLMMTTLHWMLSKSLYFTQFIIYDKFGDARVDSPVSAFVFSSRPALLTLVLSLATVSLTLGLGARRLPISIPLAGNCSAAISAACHPPRGDSDAALQPVMWGEFDEPASDVDVENDPVAADDRDWDGKAGYARCGFSAGEVAMPSGIRLYA